jgi:predicted esterase
MSHMEICEFPAPVTCRYLLAAPEVIPAEPAIMLTLHGYGSNPETMMRLTTLTVDSNVVVASLQAPNQHYTGDGPRSGVASYNWGIRQHHADSVRLHHDMVLRTLAELQARFGVGPRRCFLMAFSQAVGLNFRFLGTHPDAVAGVVAICGGVPKDWEEPKYRDFSTPILQIARSEDEFFPEETAAGFAERLRQHASDVEFHMIPGQHRYPSNARDFVRPWMVRVLG